MKQYIDKAALVAEIERRISLFKKEKKIEKWSAGASQMNVVSLGARIAMLEEILSFINTLEVKDIEDLQGLEKEVAKGKNILIIKKILLRFFESANANDEEFSKAIEDIENGLI